MAYLDATGALLEGASNRYGKRGMEYGSTQCKTWACLRHFIADQKLCGFHHCVYSDPTARNSSVGMMSNLTLEAELQRNIGESLTMADDDSTANDSSTRQVKALMFWYVMRHPAAWEALQFLLQQPRRAALMQYWCMLHRSYEFDVCNIL